MGYFTPVDFRSKLKLVAMWVVAARCRSQTAVEVRTPAGGRKGSQAWRASWLLLKSVAEGTNQTLAGVVHSLAGTW